MFDAACERIREVCPPRPCPLLSLRSALPGLAPAARRPCQARRGAAAWSLAAPPRPLPQVAREADLPLPDALRPDAALPHTTMYHVNLSGARVLAGDAWCLAAGAAAGRCPACRSCPPTLPGTCLARPAVFRSAVDSWAIQQLFPIVPIHRLCEEPTVRCAWPPRQCRGAARAGGATRRHARPPCAHTPPCVVPCCPAAGPRHAGRPDLRLGRQGGPLHQPAGGWGGTAWGRLWVDGWWAAPRSAQLAGRSRR